MQQSNSATHLQEIKPAGKPAFKNLRRVQMQTITIEEIVKALGGRASGAGYVCHCPAHEDSTPSLSVSCSSDGKVLFKCHAGCSQSDVVNALKSRGLWAASVGQRIEKRIQYVYKDTSDLPALRVTRIDLPDGGKRIFQSHLEGAEWKPGGFKGKLRPYRFDEWRDSKGLFIVEGEKCADCLVQAGWKATTVAGGSKAWKSHYAACFQDKSVVILADNDRPGFEFAGEVFRSLQGVAKKIMVIQLPDLKKSEDIADWFEAGHTPDELQALLKNPPPHTPELAAALAGETLESAEQVSQTLADEVDQAWSDLKPLPRTLPEAPQLSAELAEQMIPGPIRPWIQDIAERLQVPIESVAVCAFGALSGLIGRKICIFPKRNDNWRVLCVLWSALVDRPSRKKSSTLSEAMAPLALLEDQAREEFKAKQAENKALAALRKSKGEAIKADMKEALREKDEKKRQAMLDSAQKALIQLEKEEAEQQLTERRFRTCDATVEKLGELLVENPNGLIVYRDELSGWLKGLDRFGHEHERSFFLEAWNGTGSYAVDRIGRGTLHIPALCLTIMGGIQPGRLESYVHDAIKGGSGDDGLLQRFQLLVFPEKQASEPVYIDKKPNAEAREQAFAIYRKIHELNPLEIMASSPDAGIPGLRFSDEAQALFEDWFLNLEKRLHAAHDMPASFESHLGKYRSLMPALSLMFHLISRVSGETHLPFVQIESARMAAMWCDFLEAHARKVYAICIDPETHSARALASRIQEGMVTDGMYVREIKRKHWSLLKDNDSVNQAIEVLEDCGWVKTESVRTDGKSKKLIRLHPELVKARPA